MAAAYASKAQALMQRGAELARTVAPHVKASYTATMAKNAEYVVKDPVAAEKLGKQFLYTKLASIPSRYAHAQTEVEAAKQVWARRSELQLSEVAVYGAFGAELFAMFVIGEIVGRGGTLTGYDY